MNEQLPLYGRVAGRVYNVLLAAAVSVSLAATIQVLTEGDRSKAVKSTAPRTELLDRGRAVGKYGGLVLRPEVNRNVDASSCQTPAVVPFTKVASQEQSDGNVYPVLPQFSYEGQTYTSVFGVANDPNNFNAIQNGWTLSYQPSDETFQLDHFKVEPDKGSPGMASMIGQTVATASISDLEDGAFTNYTDGQTEISFTTDFGFDPSLQPAVGFNWQCVDSVPPAAIYVP
ncbi:MAG TPA: hypothetical protein VNG32_04135 [Candidatus Dormibacteraeota bacterium]|nr:hypothetical protein [Candidatus Dormibacteraeota bacterium]